MTRFYMEESYGQDPEGQKCIRLKSEIDNIVQNLLPAEQKAISVAQSNLAIERRKLNTLKSKEEEHNSKVNANKKLTEKLLESLLAKLKEEALKEEIPELLNPNRDTLLKAVLVRAHKAANDYQRAAASVARPQEDVNQAAQAPFLLPMSQEIYNEKDTSDSLSKKLAQLNKNLSRAIEKRNSFESKLTELKKERESLESLAQSYPRDVIVSELSIKEVEELMRRLDRQTVIDLVFNLQAEAAAKPIQEGVNQINPHNPRPNSPVDLRILAMVASDALPLPMEERALSPEHPALHGAHDENPVLEVGDQSPSEPQAPGDSASLEGMEERAPSPEPSASHDYNDENPAKRSRSEAGDQPPPEPQAPEAPVSLEDGVNGANSQSSRASDLKITPTTMHTEEPPSESNMHAEEPHPKFNRMSRSIRAKKLAEAGDSRGK